MKKNTKSIKKTGKESAVVKIAGLAGEIAGKLSNQKDHLMEMAANAIDSVKTAVQDIVEKKQPLPKKVVKKAAKKVAKKVVKPAVKKSAPAKKVAASKKVAPTKKVAAPKKAVKKSAATPAKKIVKKAAKKK